MGVEFGASPDHLRLAYRRLAKETHPDAGGSRTGFEKARAAYQLLCEKGSANQEEPEEPGEADSNPARRFGPLHSEAPELPHGLRLEAHRFARRGMHHPDADVARAAFEWAQAELALLPSGRFWLFIELATERGQDFGHRYSRRQMAKALVKLGDPRASGRSDFLAT